MHASNEKEESKNHYGSYGLEEAISNFPAD